MQKQCISDMLTRWRNRESIKTKYEGIFGRPLEILNTDYSPKYPTRPAGRSHSFFFSSQQQQKLFSTYEKWFRFYIISSKPAISGRLLCSSICPICNKDSLNLSQIFNLIMEHLTIINEVAT